MPIFLTIRKFEKKKGRKFPCRVKVNEPLHQVQSTNMVLFSVKVTSMFETTNVMRSNLTRNQFCPPITSHEHQFYGAMSDLLG